MATKPLSSATTDRLRPRAADHRNDSATSIGYARVSTDDQDCAAQTYELLQAGCTIIVTEQASGADQSRPELARLLTRIQRGDTIVIVRLDRLARSVAHLSQLLEDLSRRGIGLRSLHDPIDTTTPGGRFALHILGAVAELERALIQERTKAGVAAAARAGRMPGNPGLRTGDRVTIQALADRRGILADARARAALGPWLDVITTERPATTWDRLAARMIRGGGPNWSAERLRCTVLRLERHANDYAKLAGVH